MQEVEKGSVVSLVREWEAMMVFEDLYKYFQVWADSLALGAKRASIQVLKSDIGTGREETLLDFLSAHLPTRCQAFKGGFIFGVDPGPPLRIVKSSQIDLVVASDSGIQFKSRYGDNQLGKSFTCVESTYCVISVKTTLDKKELYESICNLASVPYPRPEIAGGRGGTNILAELPLRVIFAYDGLELETIAKHLKTADALDHFPKDRLPDLIIVNNKYLLAYTGQHGMAFGEAEIPPRSYYSWCAAPIPAAPDANTHQRMSGFREFIGAFALIKLIIKIQESFHKGSRIEVDFNEYTKEFPSQGFYLQYHGNMFGDAQIGNRGAIETFLDNGGQIDKLSPSGTTLLMNAVLGNQIEMTTFLLAHRADKSLTDRNGRTALDIAIEKDFTALIELLSR